MNQLNIFTIYQGVFNSYSISFFCVTAIKFVREICYFNCFPIRIFKMEIYFIIRSIREMKKSRITEYRT
jgi:hypothetical protein